MRCCLWIHCYSDALLNVVGVEFRDGELLAAALFALAVLLFMDALLPFAEPLLLPYSEALLL